MIRLSICIALLLAVAAPTAFAEDQAPQAPDFTLKDVHGKTHKLSDFKGKWVVLEWMNYWCPYVKKHYHSSQKNMQGLQETYTAKGVVWLSICSSAEGKQGYMTPEVGRNMLTERGASPTALLLDPDGEVGHLYGATTTPDMRVISPEGRIVYSGAIDSKKSKDPADIPSSENYVKAVLDAVLKGEASPISVTRPYG